MTQSSIIHELPMIIASRCVEAAIRARLIATCSGRANDERQQIERRICSLYGLQAGRVSQGKITAIVETDGLGTKRLIIDCDNGYFDHIIT
jgi:hypothetical protein